MSDSLQTPWTAACQVPLSFTISQSLLRFVSVESVMLSNLLYFATHFSFCLSLSQHQGLRIRLPKYWSFSFSISPSSEYSRLISFRTDLFDLFVVQGTLKSSPAPLFESINSSALSLLYGPTLTSIHKYKVNCK